MQEGESDRSAKVISRFMLMYGKINTILQSKEKKEWLVFTLERVTFIPYAKGN